MADGLRSRPGCRRGIPGAEAAGRVGQEYGHLYREAFDARSSSPSTESWRRWSRSRRRRRCPRAPAGEDREESEADRPWSAARGGSSAPTSSTGNRHQTSSFTRRRRWAPGRRRAGRVEDSPFGVEAAHAAGMKAYAYSGGDHAGASGCSQPMPSSTTCAIYPAWASACYLGCFVVVGFSGPRAFGVRGGSLFLACGFCSVWVLWLSRYPAAK